MEIIQKEFLLLQLVKIEENIFGSYKFKCYGNEVQYWGNVQVIIKLREVDVSLDSVNFGVENINIVWIKIGEGIEFLNERQKLIKIVDFSFLGWKVVVEY